MDREDIKGLVEKYSVEGEVDYKTFVKDVKQTEVHLHKLYDQPGDISNRVNQQAMVQKMKDYDLKGDLQNRLGLQRGDQQPVNLLDLIRNKKNKIGQAIMKVID